MTFVSYNAQLPKYLLLQPSAMVQVLFEMLFKQTYTPIQTCNYTHEHLST